MKRHDAPMWAFQIVLDECRRLSLPLPAIHWRRGPGTDAGGDTDRVKGIRMTVGSDKKYAKLVLLHELTHWIRNTTANERLGHDDVFWDIAFALYKRYRMGVYALDNEQSYKIGAIWGAQRAGLITRAEARARNDQMTARYMVAARRIVYPKPRVVS